MPSNDEPIDAEIVEGDVIDVEFVEGETHRQNDLYQQFRARVAKWLAGKGRKNAWAEFVLAAPDFLHLLCKLAIDKDVPTADRAKLAAALAYFILPMDLIPEVVTGPAGYVDDVALSAYVISLLASTVDPAVVRRHWAGDGDVLVLIQRVLKFADKMVGVGLWARLKKMVR
ncbi:MAG: DUF1232 domain-containing protein [Planctomycetaceae bacterium]|nr:DUF1232 domain-containing protein [Planctomycetaceae bacterium]